MLRPHFCGLLNGSRDASNYGVREPSRRPSVKLVSFALPLCRLHRDEHAAATDHCSKLKPCSHGRRDRKAGARSDVDIQNVRCVRMHFLS